MLKIIEAPNAGVLYLGRQGENLVRRIAFKLPPDWDTSDPAASVQLVARRAEESTAYPVMLSCEDGVYYWDVTSADTGRDGYGLCELRYLLGEVIAKSKTWPTFVAESISEDLTDPPDAAQNYLSQVMAEGAKAAEAADRAESAVLKMPYIEDGVWMVWDFDKQAYVSTGVSAGGGGSGEGTPGAVFIPHVDADGNISWTNNGGLDNPETINIMGPQGEKGDTGDQGPQGPQGDPGNKGSDGGYYTPTVSQPDANTLRVAYTPSQDGMPTVEQVDVVLPQGSPGSNGKTAYRYAQDGGYTGSETEFAAKLAAEHLPAPSTATVGQYFRVKAVDENNVVTATEAVDAPGGGGSDWEFIDEIEMNTETALYVLADVATWKEIKAIKLRPTYNSALSSSNMSLCLSAKDGGYTAVDLAVATSTHGYVCRQFEAYVDAEIAEGKIVSSNNPQASGPSFGGAIVRSQTRINGSSAATSMNTICWGADKASPMDCNYAVRCSAPSSSLDGTELLIVWGKRR